MTDALRMGTDEKLEVVVGLDPGRKTGVAVFETDGSNLLPAAPRVGAVPGFDCWDEQWDLALDWLDRLTNHFRVRIVVLENWTQRRGALSSQPEAQWVIGAVQWLALRRGFAVKLQSTAVKAKVPDDHLQAAGWRHPNSGHARDAARHLLAHLYDTGEMLKGFNPDGSLVVYRPRP